jgi:DNA-binding beta-propeller fold protein YncE
VTIHGGAAAPVRRALAALTDSRAGSDVCTAAVSVRVPLGSVRRRATTLRASARAADTGEIDKDRLRLVCTRGGGAGERAVVVTTDFETGLLATVGVSRPHGVGHPATPIHSDAVVRVSGDGVYVVNRFLGDNLQVLDPQQGFRTLLQCSTGPGSNPHDVAVVAPDKAYVTRYDRAELWIVDPLASSCAGFFRGSIDLGPWGDGDGLPEMDQMALAGDRLFVSLERLDRNRQFAPAGKSALVVIDTTTDQVTGTIELTGANAFAETAGIARDPTTGDLLVAEAGNIFKANDGGIERVDPVALQALGFFVTEDDLGGSVTDFVIVSDSKGYAIVLDEALRNLLVAFDPSRRRPPRRLLVRTEFLPDVALAPDGTLWVADRTLTAPGIRIFDASDDRELTARPVDVGLPPFALGFLP